MIRDIITILQTKDFYNMGEDIDIAKGKYQIPRTFSDLKNLFKRI